MTLLCFVFVLFFTVLAAQLAGFGVPVTEELALIHSFISYMRDLQQAHFFVFSLAL